MHGHRHFDCWQLSSLRSSVIVQNHNRMATSTRDGVKDANFAMERTPNVNVRWWTTILPMLKFPRYLYAREHDVTTESAVLSRDNPLSERMSIVISKDIQSWKVTSLSQVTRHGMTTRLSQNWPNLQTRNQAGFSGIGIGQSAFNQMICAIHVSCRYVKWTGTLAQSKREIEIVQTLKHQY